ncbi:hypothetical protein ILUMI_17637, partial [Ignelater luminosus]
QTPQIDQQITDSKRRFKLPKIELKKFGGDLKGWLQFWSQFKNIPNSRAADLVNSFPPT